MSDFGCLEEGGQIYELMKIVYLICCSIIGDGVCEMLVIVQEVIGDMVEMQIYEVDSGILVFDWEVLCEWNVCEVWFEGLKGCVVDFVDYNLYLMLYSILVDCCLLLEELQEYFYLLLDQLDVIFY